MEKHRICKICNRRFANGKAMGGHMRSHLAKLPIPPKPNNPSLAFTLKSLSSSSSLSNHSSKDHMQTYRSVNRELSDVFMDDHDGESETESPRNPTRKRSKRRRKAVMQVVTPPGPQPPEPESVSSVTEIFSDEEVARCLLMLSRDKWPDENKQAVNLEFIEEDESDSDDDESFCVTRRVHQTLTRNKYKCKTCKKAFRSYQALGGHKASHKKIKIHFKGPEEGNTADDIVRLGQRIFKCPFCDKVFESGQALGGHKKVHFTHLSVANNSAISGDKLSLDLNLPAPEDDSEVSQV